MKDKTKIENTPYFMDSQTLTSSRILTLIRHYADCPILIFVSKGLPNSVRKHAQAIYKDFFFQKKKNENVFGKKKCFFKYIHSKRTLWVFRGYTFHGHVFLMLHVPVQGLR